MSVSITELGLDRLSVADRLRLVEELWDSIAASPQAIALSPAQKADLERRLEAYREHPQAGSPWHEAKARLQAKGQ